MSQIYNIYIKAKDKIGGNWLFLGFIFFVLFVISIVNFSSFVHIFNIFVPMFLEILPILGLVYIIMFIFNLVITNKKIVEFLKKGGYIKKLFFSVIFGILSSGPMYLWFGLLKKLNTVGFTFGHVASFSYARAIKLPLLPIMISYFGLLFSLLFVLVLFILSFLQSLVIDTIYHRI